MKYLRFDRKNKLGKNVLEAVR